MWSLPFRGRSCMTNTEWHFVIIAIEQWNLFSNNWLFHVSYLLLHFPWFSALLLHLQKFSGTREFARLQIYEPTSVVAQPSGRNVLSWASLLTGIWYLWKSEQLTSEHVSPGAKPPLWFGVDDHVSQVADSSSQDARVNPFVSIVARVQISVNSSTWSERKKLHVSNCVDPERVTSVSRQHTFTTGKRKI